jgi:pyruvate-formate lyase
MTADWRPLLNQVRSKNEDLWKTKACDLRPAWRAVAYRENSGKPEPLVRARAFLQVLMNDRLHFHEGQLLCGSHAGWFAASPEEGGFEAGLFKELQAEHAARGQRYFTVGWDHSLADYPTLLGIGVGGLIARARKSLEAHSEEGEKTSLEAMILTLQAFSDWMSRWSEAAAKRGEQELADAARVVATDPPGTFREAVQLVAFTHLCFESEGRYAMALGRFDQYMLSFYRRDIEAARLTRAEALELICHLWVLLAENGNVQNICIGGMTPAGKDGTNELSFLCLEATKQVQSPYTNLSARFHDGSPEAYYEACFDVIRTGVGFPAIFNDHVLIPGLVEIGVPEEVARDHCMVGCIETMLPGRQQAWSDSRYNMVLQLDRAMRKVRGQPDLSFERLFQAFQDEMSASIADHCRAINDQIARYPARSFPDPFLSALTRDCIGRGRDINDGGAEYKRMHGLAVMGLGTTVDSLAAVRKLVFREKKIGYEDLIAALDTDYKDRESLRQMVVNQAPKYGNDIDEVDEFAVFLVEWTARECLKHEIVGGGRFVSAMAANTSNIPAGKEVGATPDGRRAFTPLSDAASPYFGRDTKGPTALLNSVAKPDYHLVLTGSVINMKFEPSFFKGPEGTKVFVSLMKAFVRNRIPELQFNFTGNQKLVEAQKNPEHHRDLVVRVSGFSQYFVHLDKEVQDDVIRRRAHALM